MLSLSLVLCSMLLPHLITSRNRLSFTSIYNHRIFFLTEPLVESGMHRIPAMENAEIRQMINGPESFTPDMHSIIGESPEVLHT